jgi:hypothetical protein
VVANVDGMDSGIFRRTLLDETGRLQKGHPDRFKRFFVNGDSHTLGDFYRKVNDISVWNWSTWMISDDPKWQEVLQ